jgi:hypothetical protein
MKKMSAYVLWIVVLVSATITIAALAQTEVATQGSAPPSMMSTPF